MDLFQLLPYELFEEVLFYILDSYPSPHLIPTINHVWSQASLPILHSRIIITSAGKLHRFINASGRLCCAVGGGRYVEIRLTSAPQSLGAWESIGRALAKCEHSDEGEGECCRGVRTLKLVLNSYLSDMQIGKVGEVLQQINPEIFSWSGPDPDHHFSTAIVHTAAAQLCRAIHSWTSLRILNLSNISFLHDGQELYDALFHLHQEAVTLPSSPVITVSIEKAVFMRPAPVLNIVMHCLNVVELKLTDVYQESIWGPRLRRRDVEQVVLDLYEQDQGEQTNEQRKAELLQLVRRIVICNAKTERLMGGDRGTG